MIDPANQEVVRQQSKVRRWQFGLPALLGTMILLCLPFALWGAILRANQADQLMLMLLCTALPLGVLLLAALSVSVGRMVRKLRRRSGPAQMEREDDNYLTRSQP